MYSMVGVFVFPLRQICSKSQYVGSDRLLLGKTLSMKFGRAAKRLIFLKRVFPNH